MTVTVKPRYIVEHAKDSPGPDRVPLQEVLDKCPEGYKLHSFQSINSGGGYTLYWKIVFERDFT